MHVGSDLTASIPKAHAERAISPRFSGSFEALEHGDPS